MSGAVVIPGDDDEPGVELAADSARQAAVAEGGAQVREEIAAGHADEAKAAAAVALEVAQQNAETAQAVIETGGLAEQAAASAQSNADLVMQALEAQTSAINALREEFAANREAAKPQVESTSSKPEHAPGPAKQRWARR